jgi:hypothetical protein
MSREKTFSRESLHRDRVQLDELAGLLGVHEWFQVGGKSIRGYGHESPRKTVKMHTASRKCRIATRVAWRSSDVQYFVFIG